MSTRGSGRKLIAMDGSSEPAPAGQAPVALERHYSAAELAERWGVCSQTIANIFGEVPGVIKYQAPTARGKRRRVTLRIPESIVIQVHKKLTTRGLL